jgi:hypothetical protein
MRDSGHNRDMGDSAVRRQPCPKRQNFHLKNCDTTGIVFTPILYRGEFVSSKNRLRTRKRGLIV